jgi:hypothetical protein
MGIDFSAERIIDLKRQAPAFLGLSRNGKPVHYSFLIRAVLKGSNGVRLEAVRVGRRWVTSVEAIQRWAERQTPAAAESLPPKSRSTVRRRKAAALADSELNKRGV